MPTVRSATGGLFEHPTALRDVELAGHVSRGRDLWLGFGLGFRFGVGAWVGHDRSLGSRRRCGLGHVLGRRLLGARRLFLVRLRRGQRFGRRRLRLLSVFLFGSRCLAGQKPPSRSFALRLELEILVMQLVSELIPLGG